MSEIIEPPPKKKTKSKPSEPADVATVNRGQSLSNYCRQTMPNLNSKGQPLATISNIKILLDSQGIELRYNVMKKETEIIIPNESFTTDNYYTASATHILDLMTQIEMSTAQFMERLEYLADKYVWNPVERWIRSKPWDGVTRIGDLFATITPTHQEDEPALQAFIYKWMLGTVESIVNPNGADMAGILVLQGAQEIGKTWWVRKLCPEEAVQGAVRVGVGIDPSNKDSVEQCVAHWIVEFGELDGIFRKSDVAQLKAFLTRPTDTFRKSFARRKSEYPRRTSFIASVNEWSYLVDETGNRRYWTIACKAIDSYHTIDMQQLWAEIYHKRVVDGESFNLNAAEKQLLKDINDRHQVIEPIREMLAVKYNWGTDPQYWRYITATEIAQELGYSRPDVRDVRKIASFVRKFNKGLEKRGNGKDLLAIPKKEVESYSPDYDYR